jgi:hypothetical protein
VTVAPRKYRNLPTEYQGQRYDSRGEAAYAAHLDLLVAAGELRWWRRGKPLVLLDAPTAGDRITYRPDFVISPAPDAEVGFVDFKGVQTQVFRVKVRLWKAVYPGTPLYLAGKDYQLRRVA